jgi:hypothetical protein
MPFATCQVSQNKQKQPILLHTESENGVELGLNGNRNVRPAREDRMNTKALEGRRANGGAHGERDPRNDNFLGVLRVSFIFVCFLRGILQFGFS